MMLQSDPFDKGNVLETLGAIFRRNQVQLSEAYEMCFSKSLRHSTHPINLVLQNRSHKLANHQLARMTRWLASEIEMEHWNKTEAESFELDWHWPYMGRLIYSLSDNINEQFLAIQATLGRGITVDNSFFVSYRYQYQAYGYLRRWQNNTFSYCLREFDVISGRVWGYCIPDNINAPAVRKKLEKFVNALKKSRIYRLDMTDWVGAGSSDDQYIFDTRNGLSNELVVGRRVMARRGQFD